MMLPGLVLAGCSLQLEAGSISRAGASSDPRQNGQRLDVQRNAQVLADWCTMQAVLGLSGVTCEGGLISTYPAPGGRIVK